MNSDKNGVVVKKFLIFTIVTTFCVSGFNSVLGYIPTVNEACPDTVYVDNDYSCYSPGCYANMISYWHLDETIAGSVVDFYGTYDGTNNGATINQPGKVKTSYSFSSGDYVDCGDITELNSASAFTVIGWYKDNNIFGHNRHFDKGDGWSHDISGATYSGNIYFYNQSGIEGASSSGIYRLGRTGR